MKPQPSTVGLAPYTNRVIGTKGFPCRGSGAAGYSNNMRYTPEQQAWMEENKSLYYTGSLHLDISHLPQHLRHL
jgi:hypothetical protein